MKLEDYRATIERGDIPKTAPHGTSPNGYDYPLKDLMQGVEARSMFAKYGLWMVIDQQWTGELARWIGSRRCLEIMAGGGWLAKALTDHGCSVVATDDYSWKDRHDRMKPVYEVQPMSALQAIQTFLEAEILLVSWPPYGDTTMVKAADAWGPERPLVYIGEGDGGCNAPAEFWVGFEPLEDEPLIPMMSWPGIHDFVTIGYWRPDA